MMLYDLWSSWVFLLWLLSLAYLRTHRNSTSMCKHTHLPTHSKAPAHTHTQTYTHTHTCFYINKCPSAISKKGHLEPIVIVSKRVCLVVTEPVCLLHGIISASSVCICNDPTGQKPVCGWRGCKHEWVGVIQIRTEAACVLAAKGLVLQSLPYPRSASAWNWNVVLLKF